MSRVPLLVLAGGRGEILCGRVGPIEMWPEGMTWVENWWMSVPINVSFNSLEVACLEMRGRWTVDTHQFSALLPPDRSDSACSEDKQGKSFAETNWNLSCNEAGAKNSLVFYWGIWEKRRWVYSAKANIHNVVINRIFWRLQSLYWTSSDESFQNTKSFPIGHSSARDICE